MSKNQSRVLLGVFVGLFAFVFFVFILPEFRSSEIVAVRSDASLVLTSLERAHPDATVDDQWKVFSNAECDQLLTSIGFRMVEKDRWGNRIQIAGRRAENGATEFIVWSPGRDGMSGNADDIVVPEERSQELKSILRASGNNH